VNARRAGAALAAALLVSVASAAASAAETPAAAAFAKELRVDIKPSFAKEAPELVLGTVTCTLPNKGNLVHCLAHFADKSAHENVVYTLKATIKIKATMKKRGVIVWSASAPACTSSTTGRKLPC
jgi:hypothetical protein